MSFRAVAIVFGLMSLVSAGCGSVNEGPPPLCECPPGQACVDGSCVDETEDACATVDCDPGAICIGGTCVDPRADGDDDGSIAADDCDDHDPAVSNGTVLPCNTECGSGNTTCIGREWTPCSAPNPPCVCTDGETRSEPCNFCGTQERRCVDRVWEEQPGPCNCTPLPPPAEVTCNECGSRQILCAQSDCNQDIEQACGGPNPACGVSESGDRVACPSDDINCPADDFSFCNSVGFCSDEFGQEPPRGGDEG